MTGQRIAGKTYQFLAIYVEVALIYLLFCTVLTWLQKKLEKVLNRYNEKEAR